MKHDYAPQLNKKQIKEQKVSLVEVFTIMAIGCFAGLLFLAWLGLL